MKKIAAIVGVLLFTLLLSGCGDPKYGEFFSSDQKYAVDISEKKIVFGYSDGIEAYGQNGNCVITPKGNGAELVASLDDSSPVVAEWNQKCWALTIGHRVAGQRIELNKK